MAPDRGSTTTGNRPKCKAINDDGNLNATDHEPLDDDASDDEAQEARRRSEVGHFLAEKAEEQNFTVRSVVVGAAIGIIICFSNTYFGLQTGWVSGMAMPAALIGYAYFKTVSKYISFPFTPVENVLVQTVAGAVGTMPLGCGFVAVLPALNFMLKPEENGPLVLSTWKLIVWAVGVCFFGVFIAVPLRKEVIIREKLKFPSGTATALMIGVLHGNTEDKDKNPLETFRRRSTDMLRTSTSDIRREDISSAIETSGEEDERDYRDGWKAKMKLLLIAFGVSAGYTVISYFIPQLHNIPVFGLPLATQWLWTLNPSPAYVGQGIIMGPATTLHMLLGAIIGWAVLSPLAKYKGWAAGKVDDWDTGSKGWIVWISLAIMLADSIVSLGWLILRPLIYNGPQYIHNFRERKKRGGSFLEAIGVTSSKGDYTALDGSNSRTAYPSSATKLEDLPEPDAPPEQLISSRTVYVGLLGSIAVCAVSVQIVFANLIPLYATLIAIVLALLLSVMGVRALGETDLNPVSGISKLTQLVFALIIPASNKNSVIINLLAGAISESGALQAGDMMQDLKTGHLLGASPKAQFWGQLIGSFVGAIVSAVVYKLYTSVYEIPGGLFQVPTGVVWIFTARLVTGKGLPYMAWQWALGAGLIFAVLTAARIAAKGKSWTPYIPGGIAVAVGMYNTPSFTLARTIGGLINWYWQSYRRKEEAPVIVLASGLILGEGVMSILNLVLASLKVPHL